MKPQHKRLIVIAAVIILILIGVIGFVWINLSVNSYLQEGTPDAAAFNYVTALINEDYPKAFGYLSPELPNGPSTVEQFLSDLSGSARGLPAAPDGCAMVESVSKSTEETAAVELFIQYYVPCSEGIDYRYSNLTYNIEKFEMQNINGGWFVAGGAVFFIQSWGQ